jgi:phosphate uptake regulator
MFNKFKQLFERKNLLDLAMERSLEMLSQVREMFELSLQSLRGEGRGVTREEIARRDKMVNKYERQVRRHVYIHLVTNSLNESYTPLVLLNLIIDIERIGDFTKNIMEVAVSHPGPLVGGKFNDELRRLEQNTKEVLEQVQTCFKNSDEELAAKIIRKNNWVTRRCDEILMELMANNEHGLKPNETVAVALYTRYLKRVTAHCLNIATTLVNPFDSIGFRPNREEEEPGANI